MNRVFKNKINAELVLEELAGGIRFGTDALLLADFALSGVRKGQCIDLGTGSGVIPLLMLAAGCKADFVGLELQKEYAEMAEKNAKVNGFGDRFRIVNSDANDFKNIFESGRADYCITNPPYMRYDCGKTNDSLALAIARREVSGGIELFCKTASWAIKSGGGFFAIYRPDRLVTLLCAMRENRIEPKKIRFVVPSVGKKPSLVLVEGKKDGNEGISVEPNLYIYTDHSHTEQTADMQEIYNRF